MIVNLLMFGALLALVFLAITLLSKMQLLKEAQEKITQLDRSLEEMDEQGKLIMRTDMELNKTQEALDKKISGLNTLQKLSHSIGTTLEESQIFKAIVPEYIEDLGFEKCLAVLWSNLEKKFNICLNLGYDETELAKIKISLNEDKKYYYNLVHNGSTSSSLFNPPDFLPREKIKLYFAVNSFIISCVQPKEGNRGFFFVGTQNMETNITEGDCELITILANQIGQALDNARLFEKAWNAQQELEVKVEERTRQLSQAFDKVKKMDQRKSDFISSVSHELRTPLTSIKGYASILLTGKLGVIPEEANERLKKINRHSDELVHMVNDLLDISRIESGKVVMKFENLPLKEIIEKINDVFAEQFRAKNITFSYQLGDNCETILADRSQIERVFINLLGNAFKFTPDNGKISVSANRIDKNIQIDVTDTGFGIPEEAQEAIFEEFYRVENPINQEVKGTGLGLTLVKHIVEGHHGRIWVKSALGQGSTFSFTIPAN